MIHQIQKWSLFLCALSTLLVSCDPEPDPFEATGDESYFSPAGTDPIRYQVDSVIYDPSLAGTDRIATSSVWSLSPIAETTDSKPFYVTVDNLDSAATPVQRYIWDFQTNGVLGGRHINQLDGYSYVSLVTPFTSQSTWDALQMSDPSLVITVAGDPLEIHKDWSIARIDSIGPYTLPDGSNVDAVFVILTASENAIELREFKEIYGKGYGLLERSQRMLDTQQSGSTDPWEEKAENGFTVEMKRLF
ncbi:MAG: hypothetical protein AB8F78_11210 [Saprospiraceae bacterium]